jgi:hypothetical protein
VTGTPPTRPLSWSGIVLAALVLTLSNAWKPVVVDDTAYLMVANQIAESPADPYGFELLWRDRPQPANQILAPAVLPYWTAIAMALFGHSVLAWKLWLLPFALMLAFATHRLARRLAPGRELLAVWLVVLTPGVLAGFNLMTDVPALALSLLALALSLDAVDEGRFGLAVAGGLIAGLAMQTKYASAGPVAVAVLYGLVHRRLGVTAGVVAAAGFVFLGWEGLLVHRYGESHLSHALASAATGDQRPFGISAIGWLCLLGATCPGIGLLLLAGSGIRLRFVLATAALACVGIGAIALLDAPPGAAAYLPSGSQLLGPELLPLGMLGVLVLSGVSRVAWQTWRSAGDSEVGSSTRKADLLVWVWLAVELFLYAFFAPFRFLAARRLLGLSVALALLAARLASRGGGEPERRMGVHVAIAFTVAYGVLFQLSDFSDAIARRDAVALAEARLVEQGADAADDTIWFVGHWGFRFHAERAGMQPIIPEQSRLEAGDWLIVPTGVSRQALDYPRSSVRPAGRIESSSGWPWSTIPSAYIGMLPLRRQPRSQLEVEIYRVTRPFVPLGAP